MKTSLNLRHQNIIDLEFGSKVYIVGHPQIFGLVYRTQK